jgi:hypothetical protein
MPWTEKPLPKDEMEDFVATIRESGLRQEEFKLVAEEDSPAAPDSGIGPVPRRVTISRNGIERRYEAGHGTNWNGAFEADLKAKYFG